MQCALCGQHFIEQHALRKHLEKCLANNSILTATVLGGEGKWILIDKVTKRPVVDAAGGDDNVEGHGELEVVSCQSESF